MNENINFINIIHKFLNSVLTQSIAKNQTYVTFNLYEPNNINNVKIDLTKSIVYLYECLYEFDEKEQKILVNLFGFLESLKLFNITTSDVKDPDKAEPIQVFRINLSTSGIFAALSTPENLALILKKVHNEVHSEPQSS